MLLAPSSQEEVDLVEEVKDNIFTESSQPASPTYGEMLDVMAHTIARLDLAWGLERMEVTWDRLNERFLSGHNHPSPMSLPILEELERSLKPYLALIQPFHHSNYTNVDGLSEQGYLRMPLVEETFASYLSFLPCHPSHFRSLHAWMARCMRQQRGADGALHTMAVLQAFQMDLEVYLDQGQGLSPEAVGKLYRTQTLRATNQPASAGLSGSDDRGNSGWTCWTSWRKDLLDAPVSPSELSSTSSPTTVVFLSRGTVDR